MPTAPQNFPESEYLLSLDSEELNWVTAKHLGKNQLAFAVMLKFFQIVGRYPADKNEVPDRLIACLASQLATSPQRLDQFAWKDITAKRFRQEIRHLLGYRKPTAKDKENFKAWLIKDVLSKAPTSAQCHEKISYYFRESKLEPIATQELERLRHSAQYQFEKQFFAAVTQQLSIQTKDSMADLLQDNDEPDDENEATPPLTDMKFRHVKKEVAGHKLKLINFEIDKVNRLRTINLPPTIFDAVARKVVLKYHERILTELPSEISKHPAESRYAMLAAFSHIQLQKHTDGLADLLIQRIHQIKTSAESSINQIITSEVKRVDGKFDILYSLSKTASENPKGVIQKVIYPKVSQETLRDLTKELHNRGSWYQTKVQVKMRSLYSHAHRQALLSLLNAFDFQTNQSD